MRSGTGGRPARLAAAAALAAVLAAACDRGEESLTAAPQRPSGVPFALAFSQPDTEDGYVTLAAHRGRVVVVALVQPVQSASREATHILVSLDQRFADRGLTVIGLGHRLSTKPDAAREALRSYTLEMHVPFPMGVGTQDVREQLPGGFEGYPTLLVVDRLGVCRAVFDLFTPADEPAVVATVERLLAETF